VFLFKTPAATMSFLPGLKMSATVDVQDQRLSIALATGYFCVLVWGTLNVFYHAEYFEYLPIAPVSQGGYVADTLGYDAASTCTAAQNAHCTDEEDAQCTVITPDEVVYGGTVYQGQLYVTTKMEVLSHVKTCTGNVVQGMCVGVCSEEEADRLTLYTAGIEGLSLTNSHASKDPHAAKDDSSDEEGGGGAGGLSTHHHCELKGSMSIAPIASGPCADATASLAFDGGVGDDGTCYEGDAMTVGQLLRNTDLGAKAADQLLGANGEIKPAVRDRCVRKEQRDNQQARGRGRGRQRLRHYRPKRGGDREADLSAARECSWVADSSQESSVRSVHSHTAPHVACA
jgi:hypothetical protein